MVEAVKRIQFGWVGDRGMGQRLIAKILAGIKTATSAPAYDPQEADVRVGDVLELSDKHGRGHGCVIVTRIELRTFGSFDDALAAQEGTTLDELREGSFFANGRELRAHEEMRVVHFELVAK